MVYLHTQFPFLSFFVPFEMCFLLFLPSLSQDSNHEKFREKDPGAMGLGVDSHLPTQSVR